MIKNKIRYGDIIAESYYPKGKNNGLAIVFCMGLPSKSNFEELAKRYVDEGFIFIHPKYIGSWESYGNFSISSCKETIVSIIQGLKERKVKNIFGEEFNLNIKDIFLLGHSFGGSVALSAGADLDIKGIIALSPVLDYSKHVKNSHYKEEDLSGLYTFLKLGFENVYRNLKEDDWKNLCETGGVINPIDYSDKLRNKLILLIHGKNDSSVSSERSKQFFNSLKNKNENSQFIETDNDHSNIKEESAIQVISWIKNIENE